MWAKNKQPGFTIVELLIVIVVIGILAAITIVAYNGIQQRARDSKRTDDIAKIARALHIWSLDTGKTFQEMNAGNSTPANGFFDASYSATPSVQTVLETGNYLPRNVNDPLRASSTDNTRWHYMLVPCTSDTSDNRRVVMTELENPPAQTVAQQISAAGCNHAQIATYTTTYKMNYVRIADAR